MTTWTEETTTETGWASKTTEQTTNNYDNGLQYNLDYITYDGLYVLGETDWSQSATIETAWAE